MPIPQDQTVLKSYFETGDTPTQAQFAELIDTLFSLFQTAQTTAAAAVTTANAANTGRAMVRANVSNITTHTINTLMSVNVASISYISTSGGFANYRMSFTTAYANTNYLVPLLTNVTVVTKSTGYLDFRIGDTSTAVFEILTMGQ